MALDAEADVEEAEAKPAKRGIPRRLLIMGGAGFIVLLLAGAALYFFVFAAVQLPLGVALLKEPGSGVRWHGSARWPRIRFQDGRK